MRIRKEFKVNSFTAWNPSHVKMCVNSHARAPTWSSEKGALDD